MTQVGPLFCLHFEHPVTWMLPHRYGKVGMKYHLNISFEEPPTCLPKKNHKNLHRPGIEPGPPAWQASILPLNQRCSLAAFRVFCLSISGKIDGSNKKIVCIVRESNPGRPRGRRAFYH